MRCVGRVTPQTLIHCPVLTPAPAIAQVLGPFTGCGINPSRVLGSVIWNPASFWTGAAGKNLWIYFVGPFIASIAGPLFYYVL